LTGTKVWFTIYNKSDRHIRVSRILGKQTEKDQTNICKWVCRFSSREPEGTVFRIDDLELRIPIKYVVNKAGRYNFDTDRACYENAYKKLSELKKARINLPKLEADMKRVN